MALVRRWRRIIACLGSQIEKERERKRVKEEYPFLPPSVVDCALMGI
ncbi:uncharacterized protein G2W53_036503 [Senna tora]|uniref:Uncharacterized protein n=1 Tax=Senna tora TaxID=362788 RepID=A0A834SW08_9FABA|nr:uncharacterized protein G2W53_036503 [Senna tora]